MPTEELEKLRAIRKGNKIVNSKEFKLVFYITCFVPFIRPEMPTIREGSLQQAKEVQKDNVKRRRQALATNKEEGEESDLYQLDYSTLDLLK